MLGVFDIFTNFNAGEPHANDGLAIEVGMKFGLTKWIHYRHPLF
jgi:hypothetical protein